MQNKLFKKVGKILNFFCEYGNAFVFATNGAVNFGSPEWEAKRVGVRQTYRGASELAIAFVPPHCAKYFITH